MNKNKLLFYKINRFAGNLFSNLFNINIRI